MADLDAVMAVETGASPFPWTRGNFIDSLAAGYLARVLCDAGGRVLGYFVAMKGVEEMHLLNITVAREHQGSGHAHVMHDALVAEARRRGASRLWLEVRQSNDHARRVYLHLGYREIAVRRGYYPAPQGRREDAVVMALDLA